MVAFAESQRLDSAKRVSTIKCHDGATPLTYFEYTRDTKGLITKNHMPVANDSMRVPAESV